MNNIIFQKRHSSIWIKIVFYSNILRIFFLIWHILWHQRHIDTNTRFCKYLNFTYEILLFFFREQLVRKSSWKWNTKLIFYICNISQDIHIFLLPKQYPKHDIIRSMRRQTHAFVKAKIGIFLSCMFFILYFFEKDE